MTNKDKEESVSFLDAPKKWRALFAEVWGTFFIGSS
jgi:hypothetical protein